MVRMGKKLRMVSLAASVPSVKWKTRASVESDKGERRGSVRGVEAHMGSLKDSELPVQVEWIHEFYSSIFQDPNVKHVLIFLFSLNTLAHRLFFLEREVGDGQAPHLVQSQEGLDLTTLRS